MDLQIPDILGMLTSRRCIFGINRKGDFSDSAFCRIGSDHRPIRSQIWSPRCESVHIPRHGSGDPNKGEEPYSTLISRHVKGHQNKTSGGSTLGYLRITPQKVVTARDPEIACFATILRGSILGVDPNSHEIGCRNHVNSPNWPNPGFGSFWDQTPQK